MSTQRRQQLDREIADVASEIREMEKVLDERWYRNLVQAGEEMVAGTFGSFLSMPLETLGDFVRLVEARGKLQGMTLYGGMITSRLEDLQQTLKQLKQEFEREPEDDTTT